MLKSCILLIFFGLVRFSFANVEQADLVWTS